MMKATSLLGVDPKEFKSWLVKRQITTRGEKFVKDLRIDQAVVARDSLAKYMYDMFFCLLLVLIGFLCRYTRLFNWIVKNVNSNLKHDSGTENERFIGVLDIYG
jgi:myosin V